CWWRFSDTARRRRRWHGPRRARTPQAHRPGSIQPRRHRARGAARRSSSSRFAVWGRPQFRERRHERLQLLETLFGCELQVLSDQRPVDVLLVCLDHRIRIERDIDLEARASALGHSFYSTIVIVAENPSPARHRQPWASKRSTVVAWIVSMRCSLAAVICVSALSGVVLRPAAPAAQTPSPLGGVWSLNRSLSDVPREIGFNVNWAQSPGGAGQGGGSTGGGGGSTGGGGRGRRGGGGGGGGAGS